jgi:FkbM family methyltransferase
MIATVKHLYHWLGTNITDLRYLGLRFVLGRLYHWARQEPSSSLSIASVGPFQVRAGSSDIEVIRQIFCDRQYSLERFPAQLHRIVGRYESIMSGGKMPLIIDAGANNGASALWFCLNFPRARIVAIEPDPENFRLCQKNTYGRAQILVVEGAIGSEPGHVQLDRSEKSAWAVKTLRNREGQVPVLTIDNLVDLAGRDSELLLVKIDIEGFESDLFSTKDEWIDRVQAIFVELHDWMLPGKYTSSTLQKAMGSRRFELLVSGENLIYVR